MRKMISLLTIASVLALGGPAALAKSTARPHRSAVTRQAPRSTKKHSATKGAAKNATKGMAKAPKTAKAPVKRSKKVASVN